MFVTGMMETVRIRRSGYPVRRTFEDFLFRYNVLGRGLSPSLDDRQRCEAILSQHVTDPNSRDWQPGKTKVHGYGSTDERESSLPFSSKNSFTVRDTGIL